MDKIETLFGWAMYGGIVLLALMLIPMVSSLNLYGETVIYTGGGTTNLSGTALLLDQTTPQTVADGSPIFDDGITFNEWSRNGLGTTMTINTLRTSYFNFVGTSATDAGAVTDITTAVGSTSVTGTTILNTNAYRLFVGSATPFTKIGFWLNTFAVNDNLVVEYWNGGTWTAVSNKVDGTTNFASSGDISWDLPVGWATTTKGTYTGYFVKIRSTTSSSPDAIANLILPISYSSPDIFQFSPNPLDSKTTGGIWVDTHGRVSLPVISGALRTTGGLTTTSGVFAGAVSGISTLGHSSTITGTIPTLFVPTGGHSLNRGGATTGVTSALIPIQYSPSLHFLASAWNVGTAVNNNWYSRTWVEPYVKPSGSTLATGRQKWEHFAVTGALTERDWFEIMSIGDTGERWELNVLGDTYANQSLTNGNLTSGTSWTVTGGAVLASNAVTYTHAVAQGSIYQPQATMAIALKPNRWYRFLYTTSSPTITVQAYIDESYTSAERVYLPATIVGAGNQQITFKTNSNPTGFKIQFTSAVGAITLDSFSLKEVTEGNIVANGLFTGGGTEGIKIDQTGKTGINNTAPAYTLDVIGTINVNDNYAVNGTLGISKRITFSNSTVTCTLDFTSGLLTATTCP